jgi:hypothetical protein
MESLRRKLHEQIFDYLLSPQDLEQLFALPVSTQLERSDIYNIRLTSKRLHVSASRSFLCVFQDILADLRAELLSKLAALVALPDPSDTSAYLTFNTHKMFLKMGMEDMDEVRAEIDGRSAWLLDHLRTTLVSIMRTAPRVRRLICRVEGCRITGAIPRAVRSANTSSIIRCLALMPEPLHMSERSCVVKGGG